MDVVAEGVDQPEEGPGQVRAQLHPMDHGEAPEGGHIGDEIVDVGEVRTVRVQGGQIPLHPFPVQGRALEGPDASEGVEIGLDAEVIVQILTAQARDAGAQRPAQNLRGRFRVGVLQRLPLLPDHLLHGQIHIPPAVMDPQLQGFALELDGPIVPAGELEHVGEPVHGAEGPLKMDLDHVPLRLVMHLIIDLVGHPARNASHN